MRSFFTAAIFSCLALSACGGRQRTPSQLDTRPLEESKAFDIIEETLTERGYITEKDVEVSLSNQVRFLADYRVQGEAIAIEYLSERDRLTTGEIPPAAAGSRLHVLAGNTVTPNPEEGKEPLYIFFIDDRNFIYQYNPTSEKRANVTLLEVDSRLRRDLADFLSWYETNIKKR